MAEPSTDRKRQRAKRSPAGASPGTLLADPNASRSALTLTAISPENFEVFRGVSLDAVEKQRGKWPLIWLDCTGLADVDLIAAIGRMFSLHPLALEDTVNTSQRPKIDFFEDHAFAVLRMIDADAEKRFEQISIYFGTDFVVTFQEHEGDPFDPVRKRIASSTPNRLRNRKGDYFAYALIDAIVDGYFAPVEAEGDAIEKIEDEMMTQPEKRQMRELHRLRREAIVFKHALWPLRDALAGLVRTESRFVADETRVFISDALDHTVRLIEIVETQRDTLTGLIDLHLSLSQARTNDIVSLLTIVSVIFIPLTFLVGIWGMNFNPDASPWNMPELSWYYGYPIALGLMAVIAVVMALFFRWKKWL